MRTAALVAALGLGVAVALSALPAAAQAPGGATLDSGELKTEIERRRFVVQPKPDTGAVAQDIEDGRQQILQRTPSREVTEELRESRRPELRRPDLGYDVTQGKQTRNLDRALGR